MAMRMPGDKGPVKVAELTTPWSLISGVGIGCSSSTNRMTATLALMFVPRAVMVTRPSNVPAGKPVLSTLTNTVEGVSPVVSESVIRSASAPETLASQRRLPPPDDIRRI